MNTLYVPPTNQLAHRILQQLVGVKQSKDGWKAKCPSHHDEKQSLSVGIGDDGRVLLHCFAGCDFTSIITRLGLTVQDLYPESERQQPRSNADSQYAAIYDYTDERGNLLFQVCRKEKFVDGKKEKDFPVRRPDPERYGQWIYNRGGIEPVLYHLPEVLKEIREGDGMVFLVEGEKDVDRLRGAGLIATTAPFGADKSGNKWLPQYSQSLIGAHVALLGDNDEPGQRYMAHIAASLYGQAATVRIIDLGLAKEKGDISDWLDMGHTIKELKALRATTPNWQPTWSRDLEIEVEFGLQNTFVFGKRCFHRTTKKINGEETLVEIPFARNVWPRERYRCLESGEHGYRFLYLDEYGKPRHATISAGAAVDSAIAKKACSELAGKGIEIAPDSRGLFAIALGYWRQRLSPPLACLVATSGWHSDHVYVNGDRIFGAPGWYVDEASPAIVNRTGRGGTIEGWCEGIKELITTRGLQLALAQSLAGALIEPLHLHPFALHLCVDSTRGKSTAALLAASIWGHPDQTFRTWNTTAKSPEALAEQMNGAVLVLDEMAQFEGDARTLGQTIHALCSPVGRSALDKNRDLSEQRRWRCTILSTGEVSARQRLGEFYQGGHRVRFLDVHCNPGDENAPGELTTSKQHAEQVSAFCHEHYGVVSDAWISYLLKPGVINQIREDYQKWRERAEKYSGSNPENGRIGAQLAVLAVALGHAAVAGLLPWGSNEIERVLVWAIQATLHSDAEDDESEQSQFSNTPQGRAYEQLITEWISQPHRFPDIDSIRAEMARDVVAYKRASIAEHGTCLFTTEGMLKRSRILESAGLSQPRKWIDWCVEQGLAERSHQSLPIGGLRRWVIFRPRIG